ncbi:Gfo/Idh/MocA family oxidoreductase [Yeosuana sp. MJ-SS3]|uniref:Gfo/Idh/MocA family oxidoreductase n=1 Tax=Gilvirhabdus luticola TaxID=3079858 RepID=A0ABU3U9Y8_9FLAO|nr:Gfo/Idh/MocA family oxidoreductase [Yeosuana sp. MJ-SS3]MDU8887144.1 Gfo/Idh/MocA family oxidoreductase [Yeosuana sp. MJ-SS3]
MPRKLRMGMIGGGLGSFIGDVHRKAAGLDGMIDLVCGAFSSTTEKSKASGKALFLPEDRCYGNYEEMILKESKLTKDIRMDFVAVVTPNHMHFKPTKMALEHGFHVVCDKPVTLTLEEAEELYLVIKKSGKLFALTHNYSGYPMVKQARAMVMNGDLGNIRKVQVQYIQGWLATNKEHEGHKQAKWRVDPKRSGIGGGLGDIGTHAENLISYVTGLEIEELAADLTTFGKGRILDDDGHLLLRLENGAKGIMSYSQIALGEENNFAIRVYGDKGSIVWKQENPNRLVAKWLNEPNKIYTPLGHDLYPEAIEACRIPKGHPEGYIEAFANIYKNFALHFMAILDGNNIVKANYPSIEEGLKGMRFIYASVESNKNNAKWTKINK